MTDSESLDAVHTAARLMVHHSMNDHRHHVLCLQAARAEERHQGVVGQLKGKLQEQEQRVEELRVSCGRSIVVQRCGKQNRWRVGNSKTLLIDCESTAALGQGGMSALDQWSCWFV
jgi:hypothetical protein